MLAAASCQLLSFLAVAARARIDVLDYRDEAAGEMPEDALTQITLRPQITVAAAGAEPARRRGAGPSSVRGRSPRVLRREQPANADRRSSRPLRFVR